MPVYLRESDPLLFRPVNVPVVEAPCAVQFSSATSVLPDRYR
jgi:hypothetical protein